MRNALDDAVQGNGLVTAFQPVVSLPSQSVVGYEALARWPQLNDPSPAKVFAHAERTGRLDHLDRACIRSAARFALHGSGAPGMLLLVNCEPTTTFGDFSADRELADAAAAFRVVFELTERGLLESPRTLLRKVAVLRSLGYPVALDDVGADPRSLAMMDIVEPDIVKLDMGLVQRQPDREQARTVAAVIAHHERTGAVIVAEGIENDEHLEQALAYGATLGQGYLFGRPGLLDTAPQACSWPPPQRLHSADIGPSTFEVVAKELASRTVRKQTLAELSRHIERLALSADSPPIVLTTLQEGRFFNGSTRRRYQDISQRSAFTAIFGQDLPRRLGSGLRGVALDAQDPLSLEWTILVLGPDQAAGLIAREQQSADGVGVSDNDRRFDMIITFDRALIAKAARTLLDRVG